MTPTKQQVRRRAGKKARAVEAKMKAKREEAKAAGNVPRGEGEQA
jgi:hypothetical protein